MKSQYQSSLRQLDSFYQIGLFRLFENLYDSEQKQKFIYLIVFFTTDVHIMYF